jgi:hypothetical protein
MDKLMSEQGFMACGWLCGALGVLFSEVVEWGLFTIPGVSAIELGFVGVTGALCFFGLSLMFRGL